MRSLLFGLPLVAVPQAEAYGAESFVLHRPSRYTRRASSFI